jgi:hypothetical protein
MIGRRNKRAAKTESRGNTMNFMSRTGIKVLAVVISVGRHRCRLAFGSIAIATAIARESVEAG